jgi:uncharacterized protein YqeY
MPLKDRVTEDMKTAMRAGEKERLATIRLILAAIKQREVDERITLEAGGRADLVAKESAEIGILQTYLPAQMSDAEIDALIAEAIASTGAASIKDMGKVMGAVKARAQGRADMGAVSARIKQKLSG